MVPTLAAAKKQIPNLSGPATVTVEVSPDLPPLSVEVRRWTVQPSMAFRDVKMRRSGGELTFTGRLVTEKGKPVASSLVGIVSLGKDGSTGISSLFRPKPNGTFVATTKAPRAAQSLAVVGHVSVDSWALGAAYSRPLRYKP